VQPTGTSRGWTLRQICVELRVHWSAYGTGPGSQQKVVFGGRLDSDKVAQGFTA
jgi:hypothetical protein